MCRLPSVECECEDELLQFRVRLQHVPIVKGGGRVGQFGSGSETLNDYWRDIVLRCGYMCKMCSNLIMSIAKRNSHTCKAVFGHG